MPISSPDNFLIVCDTNVWVSGTTTYNQNTSPPSQIIDLWRTGLIDIACCDQLLTELKSTLTKPYFLKRGWTLSKAKDLITYIKNGSRNTILRSITSVSPDPQDDFLFFLASETHATHIISGDQHVLSVKNHQSIPVITPKQFIKNISLK